MILTTLLLVLLAGMGVGGFYLLDYLITGVEMDMPLLRGKTRGEAIEIIFQNGLELTKITEQDTENYPPGIVIEQDPYAGKRIKKGRGVFLTVSAGPNNILVPNILGEPEEEIAIFLSAKGLEVGQRAMIHHPTYPKGTIIAQDPPSGPQMLHDKKVDVLISLGPAPNVFVMPNLQGMDMDSVRKILHNTPFTLTDDNIVMQKTDDATKWNRVMSQRPSPGEEVVTDENLKITLGFSGEQSPNMRMVWVNFPIPSGVDASKLVLIVWDEQAKALDRPTKIPLQVTASDKETDLYVPIVGNALIMLTLDHNVGDQFAAPLHSQYFENS